MAISIPSDLVLDVARAADPSRVAQASASLNAGVPVSAVSQDMASAGATTQKPFSSFVPENVLFQKSTSIRQAISPEKKAANDLETLLLQQMLESMLPKENGAAFGQGTAGAVWRSMMAEQMARQLSTSGEINLSNILARKIG
jgi:flagellar protein FlgJ